MQFGQVKRREFITLLGGAADSAGRTDDNDALSGKIAWRLRHSLHNPNSLVSSAPAACSTIKACTNFRSGCR